MRRGRAPFALLAAAPAAARADVPLQYLSTHGPRADPVTALTWGLMIISIVVVALLTGLVVVGVVVRRAKAASTPKAVPLLRGGGGMGWLAWGAGLTLLTLAASVVWTVVVLAQVNGPPRPAPLTIDVGGVQWWWRARYPQADPNGAAFETANELHVPVGAPVRVRLRGEDVIHSFWPPALTGKTDAIPGRVNETWLQADRPGRYMGQCTEFCGAEHARMAFFIQADPPAQFEAWRRNQAKPAVAPADPQTIAGEQVFRARCASCHTIRGVSERGRIAPDLTHVASRPTLAAGAIANTTAGLSGWISDPQAIKPGNRMPNLYLSGPELQAVTAYLMSLK